MPAHPTPAKHLMAIENPSITIPGLREPLLDKDGEPIALRPYQIVDVAYHCLNPRSCNAEWTGAGKKLIAISTCLKLMSLNRLNNVLIISLGVDVKQWVDELTLYCDDEVTVQEYRGSPKERKLMRSTSPSFRVTSYQTASADAVQLLGKYDGVILDEVSFLKNPDTNANEHVQLICAADNKERHVAARRIWDRQEAKAVEKGDLQAKRPFPLTPNDMGTTKGPSLVLPLSATPVETSPMDIFSMMQVMLGSRSPLGNNAAHFKRSFCVVHHIRVKIPVGRNRHITKKFEKIKGVRPDRKTALKSLIEPFTVRHPWDQVAPFLPELEVIPDWIELGSKQKKRYLEIADGDVLVDYVKHHAGKTIESKQVGAAIKQFYMLRCCDGLNSLPNQDHKDSVKLNRVIWWLKGELSGEKVVIYSRFHQPLNDLEVALAQEDITFTRIDGKKTDEENEQAQLDFWKPDGPTILLCTSKASYALNLQVARYMICYNTIFNPKKIRQLYGRIRRGQGDACVVIHILCKNTVEEPMWILLREREEMADEMGFDENESVFSVLTPQEQEQLILHGLGST